MIEALTRQLDSMRVSNTKLESRCQLLEKVVSLREQLPAPVQLSPLVSAQSCMHARKSLVAFDTLSILPGWLILVHAAPIGCGHATGACDSDRDLHRVDIPRAGPGNQPHSGPRRAFQQQRLLQSLGCEHHVPLTYKLPLKPK